MVLCVSWSDQHIAIVLPGVSFFKVYFYSLQECSYLVNNSIVNRGMVYLTGYTDSSSGKPYEVFLVAGDRIRITLLVKYKNT